MMLQQHPKATYAVGLTLVLCLVPLTIAALVMGGTFSGDTATANSNPEANRPQSVATPSTVKASTQVALRPAKQADTPTLPCDPVASIQPDTRQQETQGPEVDHRVRQRQARLATRYEQELNAYRRQKRMYDLLQMEYRKAASTEANESERRAFQANLKSARFRLQRRENRLDYLKAKATEIDN